MLGTRGGEGRGGRRGVELEWSKLIGGNFHKNFLLIYGYIVWLCLKMYNIKLVFDVKC